MAYDSSHPFSFASMLGKASAPASAPVPTQSFNAANIFGTPLPQVGDQGGPTLNYASANQPKTLHVVLVAIAIFLIGYLAYHFNFEK